MDVKYKIGVTVLAPTIEENDLGVSLTLDVDTKVS